mmetsp:Transcript_28850/g.54032  ORF Transcript_28850/g.54032 Transcript_28850/m.54032 type:complete len:226 (-) Transcript_28850:214-891(-)
MDHRYILSCWSCCGNFCTLSAGSSIFLVVINVRDPSCAANASSSPNPGFPPKSRRLSTARNSPSRNENGALVRRTVTSPVSSVSMFFTSAVTVSSSFSAVAARRCLRSGVRTCQRCPWKYHLKTTRSSGSMPLTLEHSVRKSCRLGGDLCFMSATVGFTFFSTAMSSSSIFFGILERSRLCTSLVFRSIATPDHTSFSFFSSSSSAFVTAPSHTCMLGGRGPNTP